MILASTGRHTFCVVPSAVQTAIFPLVLLIVGRSGGLVGHSDCRRSVPVDFLHGQAEAVAAEDEAACRATVEADEKWSTKLAELQVKKNVKANNCCLVRVFTVPSLRDEPRRLISWYSLGSYPS